MTLFWKNYAQVTEKEEEAAAAHEKKNYLWISTSAHTHTNIYKCKMVLNIKKQTERNR